MSNFDDLLEIYNLMDEVDDLEFKLETLDAWLNRLAGVSHAAILNLVIHSRQITEEILMDKESVNPLEIETGHFRLGAILPEKPDIIYCQGDELSSFLKNPVWKGKILCYPVQSRGKKLGAILLKGEDPLQIFRDYDVKFRLVSSKLREIFRSDFLRDKLEKENDFLTLFMGEKGRSVNKILSVQDSNLINWINLPLYIADIQGNIIYANREFLKLLKLEDVKDLYQGVNIFSQPAQRNRELEILLKESRVDSYRLTVTRRDGVSLDIRDSALVMGEYIFGYFFDVTQLVRLNRDLKEALNMQELLNDKLIASSLLLQRTQATTIRSLARLAEYRDGETGEHLDRICEYSAVLTQEVYKKQPYKWRISEKYISDLIVSSMLHDIGKVGVPDSILLKPGRLDNLEFERMKNHTVWGWAILNQADMELGEQSYLTLASAIALHHHERYNGDGYPHQLKGEKIPLSARIGAIVDVYDALTSSRPYKEAWDHDRAVTEIEKQQGEHFDPVLVEIFLGVEDKIFNIRNKLMK